MAMDSSTASQEMRSQTLESMVVITKPQQEKKTTTRSADQQPQNCPRCDSTNTKFCYYNNYSLSQPRYFCKSCRRYWTKGGTLRNVPVGGGCRKNKRSSSSSSSSSKRSSHDNNNNNNDQTIRSPNIPCFNNPPISYGSNNDHFSIYGNIPNMPLGGVFDALRGNGGNVLEAPRGFQNMYYGIGDGINLGMGMSSGLSQEMGVMGLIDQDFGGATAAKQEVCGGDGGGESGRGMWGFPWQSGNMNGGDGNMGEFDSGRVGSWNGIASSNWHGLLNSPLM